MTQNEIIDACTHPTTDADRLADGRRCCVACWNAGVAAARAARKAQLDAMPRCAVPGCKARGTWQCGHGEPVLLCGRHKNKALRAAHAGVPAGLEFLALFGGMGRTTGADVLALATK